MQSSALKQQVGSETLMLHCICHCYVRASCAVSVQCHRYPIEEQPSISWVSIGSSSSRPFPEFRLSQFEISKAKKSTSPIVDDRNAGRNRFRQKGSSSSPGFTGFAFWGNSCVSGGFWVFGSFSSSSS